MSKSIYKASDTDLELKKSFTVFLDLLGFANDINKYHKSGRSGEHFNKIYKSFSQACTQLKFDNDSEGINTSEPLWEIKLFSDNVVLGCPFQTSFIHDESLFGLLIMGIIDFQLSLTLDGFFVRGGWSLGDLFVDENMIYGQSLLDSYNLEKAAKYPRIVLSDQVTELVFKHLKYYSSKEFSPQYKHLLKDDNDIIFINYLYEILPYEGDDSNISFDNIIKHKLLIEANLEENKDVPDVLEKYIWTANYHNFFCNSFVNQRLDEITIDVEEKHAFSRI